jgi:tetratricopeptide (TPR) repeat protein
MKTLIPTAILMFSLVVLSCSSRYAIKEPTKPWSPADQEVESLIHNGITAYDSGNYNEAIDLYQNALRRDSNSVKAMYELALTYSALEEHDTSLALCYRAMEYKYPNLHQVYLLAGTELDVMGKSPEAVEVYEEAIDRFPRYYMLYYNVGITYLNLKESGKAKAAFKSALHLQPTHSSSHLGLAMIFDSEGNTIPALFAYSRFLVLEPTSKRSESARKSVLKILGFGATKDPTNDNRINVTFNPDQPREEGDFASVSLFMSLNAALQLTKEEQAKSQKERLTETFGSIIGFLDESSQKQPQKSFFHNYYLPYLLEIKKQDYLPAFVDQVFQLENSDSTARFLRWSEEFDWASH